MVLRRFFTAPAQKSGAALLLVAAFASPTMAREQTRDQPSGRLEACSGYGPGFAKLPGTDTCVKVGGSVEADMTAGRSSTGHWHSNWWPK